MDAFLQQIQTSTDRNFLLAVKYSNILELAQQRLDFLKAEAAAGAKPKVAEEIAVVEPPPADASLPAVRDSPEKTVAPPGIHGGHDDDDDDAHGYPDSVEIVTNEGELRQVLSKHEDRFTVVKLGADWCKPCVKVAPHFHELVCNNESEDIVYAVCDMTSRSKEAAEVQRACGSQRIPYFAVFRAGSLLAGLQNSNIATIKEFIATTVADNTVTDDMMFGDDF